MPKLRDKDGSTRKYYLYVAIDRASRFVHLAVKDDETTASAITFLNETVVSLLFGVMHLLTDRGSCFTADAFEAACQRHKIEQRKTRPYTPKTNGMVERFNGRVQREVLCITIYSLQDLEILLAGFNMAYNGRRQRALKGRSPEIVLRQRLKDKPALARTAAKTGDPAALDHVLKVVVRAKEFSLPDTRPARHAHQRLGERDAAVAAVQVGWRHDRDQQAAIHVGQRVALAPDHALGRIVAACSCHAEPA